MQGPAEPPGGALRLRRSGRPSQVSSARAASTACVLATPSSRRSASVSPLTARPSWNSGALKGHLCRRVPGLLGQRCGRQRSWTSVEEDGRTEPFDDWPLCGSRSTVWCLDFLKREGLALERLERFKLAAKLDPNGGAPRVVTVPCALVHLRPMRRPESRRRRGVASPSAIVRVFVPGEGPRSGSEELHRRSSLH